jgi:hypothetical protein
MAYMHIRSFINTSLGVVTPVLSDGVGVSNEKLDCKKKVRISVTSNTMSFIAILLWIKLIIL